jgi:hypothetical protein
LRFETGVRRDLVEGVGLLQLLDGLQPLGHIEVGALERADVGRFTGDVVDTAVVVWHCERMGASRCCETHGHSDDQSATPHRCPLEPAPNSRCKSTDPSASFVGQGAGCLRRLRKLSGQAADSVESRRVNIARAMLPSEDAKSRLRSRHVRVWRMVAHSSRVAVARASASAS